MSPFRMFNRSLLFSCIKKIRIDLVRNGSTLYIPGNKASEVCAIVVPHIDFGERLVDICTLKDNIKRRNSNIDVDKLKDVWEFLLKLRTNRDILEEKRVLYSKQMADALKSKENTNQENIDHLKIKGKIVKEDLKILKASLWPIEETAMMQILAFPNVIHPKTPDGDIFQVDVFKDKPLPISPSHHLDIATKNDLVKFTSPYNYYLKNDAAIFELCSKFYASECLRKSGFVQFSNSDFVKSIVVEGCGLSHTDPDSVFILHHNEDTKVNEDLRLHLVGGGSLMSFAAYHTKNVVFSTLFPLKYFTLGRQYKPVPTDTKLGLFEVSQSSVVELFVAVRNSTEELDGELNSVVNLVTNLYKSIGFHFRVCYIPANQLATWESLRVSFQMFSPALNEYIEVGNVSVSDNYVSKRLQFVYKEGTLNFPKLISGTVLNVSKLLGCVLEEDPEQLFQVPSAIRSAL